MLDWVLDLGSGAEEGWCEEKEEDGGSVSWIPTKDIIGATDKTWI